MSAPHPIAIEVHPDESGAIDRFLGDRIYEFNANATSRDDGERFAATRRDAAGAIVAGISGYTWAGCCYVAHLWVSEPLRARGLGSALLLAAEDHAEAKGCTVVLLASHSFQSPRFYERHGYVRQAEVTDHPVGYSNIVFAKRLGGLRATGTSRRMAADVTARPLPRHLRIARPVTDLARSVRMYCDGIGWKVLATFADHEGFDGAMVGDAEAPYHFEFTVKRVGGAAPGPSAEDLVVLYLPSVQEWQHGCALLVAVGFLEVASSNPYWSARGRTFADPDGYRVVLQNASWP